MNVKDLIKNADYSEMSLKNVDVYRKRLSFEDELEAIASDINEANGGKLTVTTSTYGFNNIKVRSKRNLDAYMGKLDELGRFTVQKRDLGSVIIYNINVKQGKIL